MYLYGVCGILNFLGKCMDVLSRLNGKDVHTLCHPELTGWNGNGVNFNYVELSRI